jgi:predicted RNA-binding protein with PIN domain
VPRRRRYQGREVPPNQLLCNRRLHRLYRGSVRWIVDGMNVIGARPNGWWQDRRGAMAALVNRLERWAAAQGDDVTVVFERPPAPPIDSSLIAVAHAPKAATNSADDEIVRLVQADDRPHEIRVVTSDSMLSARIQAAGASVYSAKNFRHLIDPP